ncbi:serine/threonine-protein kinase [Psychrobacter vallis]|uniref:serine/threonine-protein kinase n=1 Tax=Psychrobacter vallis TaxID=248451 RepID=UPI001918BE19|nr:serine/threonine-protein kinase [Psychrobacter vallis]
MKNSASNSLIIQALQAHAQQLLPTVTQVFSVLQYGEIVHQRIGQTNTAHTEKSQNTPMQHIRKTGYQGLTRATHSQFGHVMIKWQLVSHASHDSSDLAHEINVLRSLNHLSQTQNHSAAIAPLILAHHKLDVQALGQSQHLTALVMVYYPNGSLAKQLSRQKYPLLTNKQKQYFIKQTANLIANLHNTGWLHNDIKPSNILLSYTSIDSNHIVPDLILIDFALAEKVDKPIKAHPFGTPAYLAPERWQGQAATVQSDIYAFGIMMVEIVTGARPFNINTQSSDPMIDWTIQHCQQPIPRLPTEYSHYQFIIDKALAKRIEKRYQTMDKILLDLDRV